MSLRRRRIKLKDLLINREIHGINFLIENLRKNTSINEDFNMIPKYYINLVRSKKREKDMIDEINKYKINNIERFIAIDGADIKDIHQGEINNLQYYNQYDNCTKYQLAISLSHISCIIHAGKKEIFPFIILEDDVRFTLLPYWDRNFNDIIENLDEDCDILSLSFGAVAYLVTKKGYETIKNIFINDKYFQFLKDDKYTNIYYDCGIFDRLNVKYVDKLMFLLDGENQINSTHTKPRNIFLDLKSIFIKCPFLKNLKINY